jgi:hypothetical protein
MRYWNDFLSAVQARQAEISYSLALGNASDYATYQRLVGEVAGLEAAKEMLNNLLKEDQDD